jgi:glycosyltransferase involved in cell wall biosynthesis
MLLFDASHTSHTRAQTGIQRVCRSLFAELAAGEDVKPVCHDPHLGTWRPLTGNEEAVLRDRAGSSGQSRGAKWTLGQKLAGHARRLSGRKPVLPAATGLVCPELFSPRVGAHLPELFAGVTGPRVAIFHDAIGLKFPELTPPGTVARLPAYLRELRQFDGVAAVSEDSAASLREYWTWLGVDGAPSVQAIPLGIDEVPSEIRQAPGATATAGARVLCVATVEGRKNHIALLDAAETLWREGLAFELELIGLARPDTAQAALDKIQSLRAAGRSLVYHGSVTDNSLHAAYARCAFTVYPSLIEGFGLPVLESLQHGKPCVCSAHGALGESARGGGCVTLSDINAASLATEMRSLLQEPARVTKLAMAARARTFRPWRDYANDLSAWMKELRVHR